VLAGRDSDKKYLRVLQDRCFSFCRFGFKINQYWNACKYNNYIRLVVLSKLRGYGGTGYALKNGLIHYVAGMQLMEQSCPGGPGPRHCFSILSRLDWTDHCIAEPKHLSRHDSDALFIALSLRTMSYIWHASLFDKAWDLLDARGDTKLTSLDLKTS